MPGSREQIRPGWEWLEAILDHTAAVIFVKDADRRYLLVNRRFESLFGVSRDAALGKSNQELFPPEIANVLDANERLAIDSNVPHEYEEVVRGPQGPRTFQSLRFVLRDSEDRFLGLCGISNEITERRFAQTQLHRQREITERLVRSSADGLLAFDVECRYTVWNPQMEQISGMPASEVLGRVAFEVFPFLTATGEDHFFHEALAGRTATALDRPYTVPESGRQGFFEGHYSPLYDVDGSVIGGLGVIREISERRRVESERLELARAGSARIAAEAAARRFSFLAEAGEVLSSSLDYEQTLRDVARLAVPTLGDLCMVDVIEDGGPRRVAAVHGAKSKEPFLDRLRQQPFSLESPAPSARVMRSGTPLFLSHVDPAVVGEHTRNAEHAELIQQIGVRSLIAVPLVARGATLGSITLCITESERRYTPDDMAFAEDLARRAAVAIDNARLYRLAQEELAERRRAEQALRFSEARFRAVIEQSPLSTQIFDSRGQHVETNRAWEKLWSLRYHDIPTYNILEDKQLETLGITPLVRRAFEGESVELPSVRYDPNLTVPGHNNPAYPVRWVRAFAYPIKDDEGAVREVVLMHEDVTARREAEEATQLLADAGETLGASLDYHATLQNLAQLVVPRLADWCSVDLLGEGGELERVSIYHTEPAQVAVVDEITRGYAPRSNEQCGARWVAMSGQSEWVAEITDDMRRVVSQSEEHLALLRRIAVCSYICVPLIARGVSIGAFTLCYAESGRRYRPADVALAKDLARRAAAAVDNARLHQQLRTEDRRKDEFLATLAHELRNPLAPIRTGLEILRMLSPGEETRRTREMMDRQLSHMVRLIDDLLDLSRVTRGKVQLVRERVDLHSIIGTALEATRSQIDAGGLTLAVRLPEEPLIFDGDRTRLSQIVSNLLNNAAKYTERGGHIELEAIRDGNWGLLRVKDTGIGIPPEMLKQIFEMFAQVRRSLDRSQGGLGIGLTLVRRLVELHGGMVWAESEGIGRGSSFVIKLPLSTAAVPSVPAVSAHAPAGVVQRKRVLVVDDNQDAAESMATLLELAGHEVRSASSGPAALETLREFVPDIAFLDIGLPGMSGYELARRLRQNPALLHVRLIALTGWGQAEDRRQSRDAGFDLHLTKPVDAQELRQILE